MKRIAIALIAVATSLGLAAAGTAAWAQGKGRDKHEERQQGGPKDKKEKKQHHHKDGKALLGDKIKQNGRHKIDQNGKFSTFVETHDGKIRSVKVNHADKGDVPVKKYKSTKKMAEAQTGFIRAGLVLTQYGTSLGTTWIGYSYYDEYGDEVIYWFEYEMIEDPDTGAIDYVPVY